MSISGYFCSLKVIKKNMLQLQHTSLALQNTVKCYLSTLQTWQSNHNTAKAWWASHRTTKACPSNSSPHSWWRWPRLLSSRAHGAPACVTAAVIWELVSVCTFGVLFFSHHICFSHLTTGAKCHLEAKTATGASRTIWLRVVLQWWKYEVHTLQLR